MAHETTGKDRQSPGMISIDVSLRKGLLIVALLILGKRFLVESAIVLGMPRDAETIGESYALLVFGVCVLLLLWRVISISLKTDIRALVLGTKPTLSQVILWALVGALFGVPGFLDLKGSGYLIDTPGYVVFVIPAIITYTLIFPLTEEPLYRGICFAPLTKRSRLLAYAGLTILFAVSHTNSLVHLATHGRTGITDQHLFILVGFGLLSAYIYESTGKLSLCIICHGVANGMRFVGLLVGYILDW